MLKVVVILKLLNGETKVRGFATSTAFLSEVESGRIYSKSSVKSAFYDGRPVTVTNVAQLYDYIDKKKEVCQYAV